MACLALHPALHEDSMTPLLGTGTSIQLLPSDRSTHTLFAIYKPPHATLLAFGLHGIFFNERVAVLF